MIQPHHLQQAFAAANTSILTTPSNLKSESIDLLKEKMGITADPVYIEVTPEPDSKIKDCHYIVEQKVKSEGGQILHGWIIWEQLGGLIEANFHSVWKDPSGKLVDLTPQRDGEAKIAFLPDSATTWKGIPIKNYRLPLSCDPSIKRSIAISEGVEDLEIEYFKKNGNGASIPNEEAWEVYKKNTRSTEPCMCLSGLKYKHCCKDLPKVVAVRKWVDARC